MSLSRKLLKATYTNSEVILYTITYLGNIVTCGSHFIVNLCLITVNLNTDSHFHVKIIDLVTYTRGPMVL